MRNFLAAAASVIVLLTALSGAKAADYDIVYVRAPRFGDNQNSNWPEVFNPGAMDAGIVDILFWASLAISLALAFVAAFPVNRWLIARGLGHAVVHGAHS